MIYEEIFQDNWVIHIGKNKEANDQLVKKSPKGALWFHIKGNPSPHGILMHSQEYYTDEAIIRCAKLVKSLSKMKDCSKVCIEYTYIKNVKPTDEVGTVIVSKKCKTIIV